MMPGMKLLKNGNVRKSNAHRILLSQGTIHRNKVCKIAEVKIVKMKPTYARIRRTGQASDNSNVQIESATQPFLFTFWVIKSSVVRARLSCFEAICNFRQNIFPFYSSPVIAGLP